jgi:outer membrane protein TolC
VPGRGRAGRSSAAADLYPRINLSAALFSESDTPGGLDASANQGYSLVGGVLAPLWQGGRLRARLDAAEASRDAAEASFQQVVLVALADVESALVSYREALAALERQRIARAASAESTRLTRDLYEAGLAELITLTEAEARLAESDSALASSRTNAATSAVALNKALGGVDDRGVDSAADVSTTSVD